MKKKVIKGFVLLVKILLSGLILYFIFRKLDLNAVKAFFFSIPAKTIILIVTIAILKEITQIVNWGHYLILNPEYRLRKIDILKSYFIGLALRFTLPGGVGSLGKIYFLENKKNHSLISIGVERFFQTWTAFFFASLSSIFYFKNIPVYFPILIFLIILFIPIIVKVINLEKKWKSLIGYRKNYHRLLPRIISIQIIYFFLTICQYYLIINSILEIDFPSLVISVPLVLFANVIPITYAGLGLRETFAIQVLSRFSISAEIALTASLGIFLINSVLPAIPGIWFILFSKKNNPEKKN